MHPEQRLEYESRVRTRQAAVAGAAGVLVMLAVFVQLPGPHVSINEKTLELITEHKRIGYDLLGAVLDALGSLALGWTLLYLFGAARAREARVRPVFMGQVAIAGGVIAAVAGVLSAIGSWKAADEFVSHGSQTWPQADAILSKAWVVVPQLAIYLGALLIAIPFVIISLGAMRVGLLPRFMGYLGVVAGVLTILPLVPIPIVEAYWLLALAYLLSGRWPSGTPPAWASGVAVPWPTNPGRAARTQTAPARASRNKRGAPASKPAREPAPAPTPTATRSTTPKRKRKRRK